MFIPEYVSREEAAEYSADLEGVFQGIDIRELIRAAGNTALYDDLMITPGTGAAKQDGPRSALYSVADFRNGIVLTTGYLYPNVDDADFIAKDRSMIGTSVRSYLADKTVLDKPTFTMAHNITVIVAFPNRREPLVNAGAEVRRSIDGIDYVSVLIPSYYRLAPKAITRYVTNMKRSGNTGINPELKHLATSNDTRKVARLMAVSALSHILDMYDEAEEFDKHIKER